MVTWVRMAGRGGGGRYSIMTRFNPKIRIIICVAWVGLGERKDGDRVEQAFNGLSDYFHVQCWFIFHCCNGSTVKCWCM